MPTSILPRGRRVVLPAFAESPEEAIASGLRLEEDVPSPDPAVLGPTDVIVEVKSASVSFVDLLMLSGQYQHQPPLPCVPGLEYAGVVAWAGAGVDPARLKLGDAVMSDFLVTGPRSLGAYQKHGGWASHAVAPQEGLHRVPAGFSFDEAANLLVNYETAYFALVTRAGLKAGETVLINGASGAAGMAAVQVAKLLGAQVIATGRSEAKLAVVKAYGADRVIQSNGADGEVRRFRDDVKAATNGRGAQVVYDTVGGAVSLECMRSLAFGGRHIIVGWAGNTKVAPGGGKRGSATPEMLPTNIMQMKGLVVMGSPMVIASAQDPTLRPARQAQVLEWARQGHLKPWVSHVFPLSDYRRALTAKLTGEVIGGCVLRPH